MAKKDTIKENAAEAIKVIANAAAEATKVISDSTAEALKVSTSKNSEDHDTLIKLVESVTNLDQKFTALFAELKKDMAGMVNGTSKQIEDHESRLRLLEKESEDHVLVKKVVYGAVGVVLLSVLSAIVYLVVKK